MRGIINLIKPVGITSSRAVGEIKKITGCKKAGHTGTLDLAAAGVLPVCINRATKIIPYLDEEEKEYMAEFTLGIRTETQDREGEIIDRNNSWQGMTEDRIIKVVEAFTGRQEQIPPMYSAVHHQGKRLYRLAREGKEVEREPREINIFNMEIIKIDLPVIRLKVNCSRGTYIRALARDMGEKLGTGAYLSFLIRTGSGPFILQEGKTFTDISRNPENSLNKMDSYLKYPRINIKRKAGKKARNGVNLWDKDIKEDLDSFTEGILVAVYGEQNEFIAISKVIVSGIYKELKPERVFV